MSEELVRISAHWHGSPNAISCLLAILGRHPVDLLDVRQSVAHSEISASMVVRFSTTPATPVLKDVLFEAHAAGISVNFYPVESAATVQLHQPHYILTLLARRITAEHLAVVCAQLDGLDVEIENIRCLAGAVGAPARDGVGSRASVALTVVGAAHAERGLRTHLMPRCREVGLDISIQTDNVYRRHRRLVAFDMDSTLIDAEVIDELAKRADVGAEVAAITAGSMRGELDFDASLRQRVGLLRGLSVAVLDEVVDGIALSEGAERLIRNLRRCGYRTAILSGGFVQMAHHLQRTLGIDFVHANELEVADGVLTGGIVGDIVNGERKVELLREISAAEGLVMEQTIAVGDGANDLPMLSEAGLGIAYHAKPVVAETAHHAISHLGLDAILYLLGFADDDVE